MVLWISSDRDNQRIFFGLKCSSPGFLFSLGGGGGGGGGRKFGKYFFRWFDLSRDFLGGIQNNLKILGSVHISLLGSSLNTVKPNLFSLGTSP